MGIFFSGPEVIEMAIRTEENGEKFYTSHAEKAEVESVKLLFTYLANEEAKHIADSKFLTNFTAEADKIKDSTDVQEVIEFAIGFEKETLLFYYGLLEFISEKGRDIVKDIIEQEKAHVEKLTSIKKVL